MPDIDRIQDKYADRDHRVFGADLLVKAPVPCFVQVSATIDKRAGQDDPELGPIKNAIVQTINDADFSGRLYASFIHDALHEHLPSGMRVGPLDLFGRVRFPDGTAQYLRDPNLIQLKPEPAKMVSDRTVQFFTRTEDVALSVRANGPTTE
jgi:hypothetical protein